MKVETVRIAKPDSDRGYVIINKADYDPEKHELHGVQEPRHAPGNQTVPAGSQPPKPKEPVTHEPGKVTIPEDFKSIQPWTKKAALAKEIDPSFEVDPTDRVGSAERVIEAELIRRGVLKPAEDEGSEPDPVVDDEGDGDGEGSVPSEGEADVDPDALVDREPNADAGDGEGENDGDGEGEGDTPPADPAQS